MEKENEIWKEIADGRLFGGNCVVVNHSKQKLKKIEPEREPEKNDPPVKPKKFIPVKPDKDPDPTKRDDPAKNDPTRIDNPPS